MNLTPLKNKLIVLKVAGTKKTDWGFEMKRSDEPDTALIIAAGPDVEFVKTGDKCLVDWNDSEKIDQFRFILPEDSVVAVFEDE